MAGVKNSDASEKAPRHVAPGHPAQETDAFAASFENKMPARQHSLHFQEENQARKRLQGEARYSVPVRFPARGGLFTGLLLENAGACEKSRCRAVAKLYTRRVDGFVFFCQVFDS
jgi:hypothetical protein